MFGGFIVLALLAATALAGNFYSDVAPTFGGQRVQISDGGSVLSLSLDSSSGSGVESYNQYLYGRFDVGIKLVAGNSAGTVATFFLSSQGSDHDEIDFEFLGNASGQPYTVHTNIYTGGIGDREQQFRLWFDPTEAFHIYTILWNSHNIIFMVDGIPIRVFKNYISEGVGYPTFRPMNMLASLWDAEDWATEGGRIKTDWNAAPFTATYRNYVATGCAAGGSCDDAGGWESEVLDARGRKWIRWVQKYHMIYNYCTDVDRFPAGLPPECKLPRF
ncbi:xyloglucan endotransglucosylase/hydrolase 1 [Genlisea aurea]|uniref:Xyloglucan endotransglucosylase/hydrolase n=1 Tax=Genlisea aurea TaxID=192259 RepID=S8BWC1_9LAMI|nr:xyloglucan endotransglucosylase/hydrolase 1 [Genlisea aurea]